LNNKKNKIYAYDRKYEFNDLVKNAKKSPGVAHYNITKYDEKYLKPAKLGNMDKQDRFTYVDSIMFEGKQKPGIYDSVKIVSLFSDSIFRKPFIEGPKCGRSGLKPRSRRR
jgi:hypothetical protein